MLLSFIDSDVCSAKLSVDTQVCTLANFQVKGAPFTALLNLLAEAQGRLHVLKLCAVASMGAENFACL